VHFWGNQVDLPEEHRKTIRHYDEPGHAHELTFSCYERRPLLEADWRKQLLSEGIDRATAGHGYRLLAFVYMPEHVHLIVFPERKGARVADLLYAIKRPVSFRIKTELQNQRDPLLRELMVQERPGKWVFRFWQEGPGYDRNLTNPSSLRAATDYAHLNPVRRGLCAQPGDWKWSSWRYYYQADQHRDPDLPTISSGLQA
jgi:putative transposase